MSGPHPPASRSGCPHRRDEALGRPPKIRRSSSGTSTSADCASPRPTGARVRGRRPATGPRGPAAGRPAAVRGGSPAPSRRRSAGPMGQDPSSDSPTTRNAGRCRSRTPWGSRAAGSPGRRALPRRHRPPAGRIRDDVGGHDAPVQVLRQLAHRAEDRVRGGLLHAAADVHGAVRLTRPSAGAWHVASRCRSCSAG